MSEPTSQPTSSQQSLRVQIRRDEKNDPDTTSFYWADPERVVRTEAKWAHEVNDEQLRGMVREWMVLCVYRALMEKGVSPCEIVAIFKGFTERDGERYAVIEFGPDDKFVTVWRLSADTEAA